MWDAILILKGGSTHNCISILQVGHALFGRVRVRLETVCGQRFECASARTDGRMPHRCCSASVFTPMIEIVSRSIRIAPCLTSAWIGTTAILSRSGAEYRKAKKSWRNNNYTNTDRKRWEHFLGITGSGVHLREECLAPLAEAGICWGVDLIRYYGWTSMGWGYCKVLGTAVFRNPDWREASIKLNQLLLNVKRPMDISVNPITYSELLCL
jgi:hypothetical protein